MEWCEHPPFSIDSMRDYWSAMSTLEQKLQSEGYPDDIPWILLDTESSSNWIDISPARKLIDRWNSGEDLSLYIKLWLKKQAEKYTKQDIVDWRKRIIESENSNNLDGINKAMANYISTYECLNWLKQEMNGN